MKWLFTAIRLVGSKTKSRATRVITAACMVSNMVRPLPQALACSLATERRWRGWLYPGCAYLQLRCLRLVINVIGDLVGMLKPPADGQHSGSFQLRRSCVHRASASQSWICQLRLKSSW